ncbi:N-6 DNA methylase [[Phormidium] sp. ETS-05]|uniref:class I SAM-dependent DNA methyltransferase n=1 Tax=[Phormidium] sp. ETS-05 TaxID=222819 RepID=UPI0018EF2A23|nr:N-6 DNA methylase [[Phormidium] sp. ETS-05]
MTSSPKVKHKQSQIQRQSKIFTTPQSLNAAIKSICDIMRRSNCAGAMQYIPELTWILFLRMLDEQEAREEREAAAMGKPYIPSIPPPYRWQDWAAPSGSKRLELNFSCQGEFFRFVNQELIPFLKNLKASSDATPRQQVISQIFANIERVNIDTEQNLTAILDKVQEIYPDRIDDTHIFPISQVYEGLLRKMGEKSNDGGQFFTPREIVRVMVKVIAPQAEETVYDPCCGTGGFLAESYQFICDNLNLPIPSSQKTTILPKLYGREKENLIYPIALANLVLHGINTPHLWHGNTLSRSTIYDGLYQEVPAQFDVILSNPPFGGKEAKEVQHRFPFKTSATQILFMQEILTSLKSGGRCGIVLDEGFLFKTNEAAFVQVKQKLLEECNLWCILSLPAGVFANAGTSLKTNILFFTKGQRTENIWYYDLSHLKINQKNPLTFDNFADFFELLPTRGTSAHSWTVSRPTIEMQNFDLKAVNPQAQFYGKIRSREELLEILALKNSQVAKTIAYFQSNNR